MSTEREDLITMLDGQRDLFRITLQGITDEQARTRSTVSELTLGGLLHHVGNCEKHWLHVIANPDPNAEFDISGMATEYVMTAEQTVDELRKEWDSVAADFNAMIREQASLDEVITLPTAPWDQERKSWSVRQVILHIVREVAHHSGHADIIRESLDGQNSTFTRAGIDPEQASAWAKGGD